MVLIDTNVLLDIATKDPDVFSQSQTYLSPLEKSIRIYDKAVPRGHRLMRV